MQEYKQTRGIRNNNPLNIIKGNDFKGERHPQHDAVFEEFVDVVYGLRAGFLILRRYLSRPPRGYGLNTVRAIITRWAPPAENQTDSYIKFVSARSQLTPDEILCWQDKNKLCRLVQAMCVFESNAEVGFGVIEKAYALSNMT